MIGLLVSLGLMLGQQSRPVITDNLHCEAATPAGDILDVDILGLKAKDDSLPALLVYAAHGSIWPIGDGKQGYLAEPVRALGAEIEYKIGNYFIRLSTKSGVRALTILSGQSGHVAQAVAFGFCSGDAIAAPSTLAQKVDRPDDVFNPSRWQDMCFFTSPGREEVRGSFHLDEKMVDDHFVATFEPRDGGIWPASITVTRELLRQNPKSDSPNITLGVGRFHPKADQKGPTGMDIIFIDEAKRLASIIVPFNDYDGLGHPGFAICGVTKIVDQKK